ncbi:hypothetical protein ACHAXA_009159, partial [Cyclostephanos tholiformis]
NLRADCILNPIKEETDACETVRQFWVCVGAGNISCREEIGCMLSLNYSQTKLKLQGFQFLAIYWDIPVTVQCYREDIGNLPFFW